MLWSIKNKAKLFYCLIPIILRPADSNECRFGYHCRRRMSDYCNSQRGSRNILFSPLVYWFYLNPSTTASSNLFRVGSRGWCTLVHQNHAAGGENGSIMVEMSVSLSLASKKPSERDFFVPTRTDLGVNSLMAMVAYVRPLKNRATWKRSFLVNSCPLLAFDS